MVFAIVRKFTGLGKIHRFSCVVPVSGGTRVLPYDLQPLQQAGTRFERTPGFPASFYWNFIVKDA